MKFQSVFILYSVVFIDFLYGKEGPLDEQENLYRLQTCGKTDIDRIKSEGISYATGSDIISTATLISSRHLITSSDLVLNQDTNIFTWIHDKKQFDGGKCDSSKEKIWIQLPQPALNRLKLGFISNVCSTSECVLFPVEASDAYIVCNQKMMAFARTMSLPMIVEIDFEFQGTIPCLAEVQSTLPISTYLEFFNYNSQGVWNERVQFENSHNPTFYTKHLGRPGEHGGSLIKPGPPHVLVGIFGEQTSSLPMFWDVGLLAADICAQFGICPQGQRPPAAITTPPPTQPPATPAPTRIKTYKGEEGSLSTKENDDRLHSCSGGMPKVRDPNIFASATTYTWLYTTATLISTRHVLTSADIVLVDGVKWKHNNKQFDGGSCITNGYHTHISVPDDLLPRVTFGYNEASITVKSRRAFIICSVETFLSADITSFPMIVEIFPNIELSPACLPSKASVEVGEDLAAYKNDVSNKRIGSREVKVNKVSYPYIKTQIFQNLNQRGPALMRVSDWTIVGVGAGGAGRTEWFFAVEWFRKDLCSLTGICQPRDPKPSAEPTPAPTVPSTTQEPTTQEPTTEPQTPSSPPVNSTTEESKSITPPLQTSLTPPQSSTSTSNRVKPNPTEDDSWTSLETDSDAENEKLKEKNKGMHEFDDWDNDFFEDRSFIKVATRIELFIVVLLIVMVSG